MALISSVVDCCSQDAKLAEAIALQGERPQIGYSQCIAGFNGDGGRLIAIGPVSLEEEQHFARDLRWF